MINLKKKGRRIEIRANEPLKGMRTTIPGAYETVGGYWTVPCTIETLQLLRTKFGNRLVLHDELTRWAQAIMESRESMSKLAASSDAKLEHLSRVAPKLARAMRKRTYQRVGARFIADSSASLVADDPGLGKTLEAMGGLLEGQIPGPYLVVAPKTAADTVWRRHINEWLPADHRAVILPELWQDRDYTIRITRYTEKTWLIVHPDILLVQSYWVCHICGKWTVENEKKKLECGNGIRSKYVAHERSRKTKKILKPRYPKLFDIEWGAVIIDESHEMLIKRKGLPTQRRRGADMLKLRPSGTKIAMSGTPFEDSPHLLWGTLNWLDPKTYSAFYRWAEMFWTKGGYTGWEIGEFREDREQLLWDSLKSVCIRRTKAEVAKDLPPKLYVGTHLDPKDENSPVGIWLPMEGKQLDAYQQMEEQSLADLESGRIEAIYALEELTRLKQMACAYGDIETRIVNYVDKATGRRIRGPKHFYVPKLPSNKFDWIVNSLEEWGYPKRPIDKVVIVSFYTGILTMMQRGIEKHFKRKESNALCTAVTGRIPSHDRRRIIDDFNRRDRGTPQIMMLNVRAGGTAITIDSADRMVFISETKKPSQQQQAEDRIHRVSNPRHCMYYYLRSKETVDIGTSIVNQQSDRVSKRLLDGRRGVEYVRRVLDLSRGFD